jgi:hypothetical protein
MSTRKLSFELPAELVAALGPSDELAVKAKEALVLELLREARIGQSKAAELLAISRADLLELMCRYQVPSGLATPEDVDRELEAARNLGDGDPHG